VELKPEVDLFETALESWISWSILSNGEMAGTERRSRHLESFVND